MVIREFFEERLVQAMKHRGVRQVDLARAVGVSQRKVSSWIAEPRYGHERRLPTAELAEKIAAFLKCNPQWLILWEGEPDFDLIDKSESKNCIAGVPEPLKAA